MEKPARTTWLIDLMFDLAGCFIFALAIQCFSAPNQIAPGGVSGVAILADYLWGFSISVLTLVLNVPLLLLAWLLLGRRFAAKTIQTVVILSAMLAICAHLPGYKGDLLLAALYGGLLEGIGLALIFMRSSTTGGSDLISRLIQLRYPYFSVGKLLLAVDGLVLIASAIVYRSIENALYGLIVIFTATRVIDAVLYGLDSGKVLMIVSQQHAAIAERVGKELRRGCTLLSGRGSYTAQERPVLLCAVRKAQFIEVKRIVRSTDPNAFMLALEAGEILGEGFKDIREG